ncbi:MAG: FkbM family methyltransferase [Candidatus Sungbacteria bacterium]|nr:FkbM family methyltransferase [Candidatus Sungbacteria bacterium]
MLLKPKEFSPVWNTLAYAPMEGIRIFFDPAGPWQKKIIDNTYDSFLFERLHAENLQGKVIFDIGAHVGFHSLYFSRLVGPEGKVCAFEPNPKNVERLKLIRDANEDVKNIISIFDVAVSDFPGTEKFSMNEEVESGRSSGGFIDTADTIWPRQTFTQRGFTETNVRTVPIDLLKEELGIPEAPDIIKIDVEGAEHLVLSGAKHTLATKKPILFLEIHSMLNMFYVVSLLSSLSYELKILKQESDGRCFLEARPRNI